MTSAVRAPRPTPRGHAPQRPQTRAGDRQRPDLRLVRPEPRQVPTAAIVAGSAVVVFIALFVAAVAHSLLVTSQVHLDHVGVELRAEQERLQREKVRLTTARSSARITREARRLGMVEPPEPNWLAAGGGSGAVLTAPQRPDATDPSTTDPSTTDSSTSADELASSPAATR